MLVTGLNVICDNCWFKVLIWNAVDGHHKGKRTPGAETSAPVQYLAQRAVTVLIPIKRKSKVTL